ncbi:MAG: tyrosine-type recombinase/integrase [Fibromonadales bacterium]|nr:tyrosine-type recombinase/integrase [Fibromonadales bacterium]
MRYSISKRNKSHGSDVWYGGEFNPQTGKTKWKSLYTNKKSEAVSWRDKMNASRFLPPEPKIPIVSLEDAVEAFLLDVENVRKCVAGTVELYSHYLRQFKTFCNRNEITNVHEITQALCAGFAQESFAKLSAQTTKNRVILFRHFFSWAFEHYDISGKNPFKKIVVIKPKPVPRNFWTLEECEKIIAAEPNAECKCWFALMAFAGLRREEARHLKMENFSAGKISLIGKGKKAATLPISTRLQTHLDKYLAIRGPEPGALFPWLSNLVKAKEFLIKNAVENSGIKNSGIAHFHRFRHSFASNLLRMGRSIKAVQILMRHESVTLTLNTYGHLLPNDLEQAAEM